MSELSDQAIVRKVLAGETAAFAFLVDRYERVVFNAAYRITNDRQDAEDVTQTVFMKVFENLRVYNPRYRFYSWMYRIAVNEALNHQARSRRQAAVDISESRELGSEDRSFEIVRWWSSSTFRDSRMTRSDTFWTCPSGRSSRGCTRRASG